MGMRGQGFLHEALALAGLYLQLIGPTWTNACVQCRPHISPKAEWLRNCCAALSMYDVVAAQLCLQLQYLVVGVNTALWSIRQLRCDVQRSSQCHTRLLTLMPDVHCCPSLEALVQDQRTCHLLAQGQPMQLHASLAV